MLDKKLPRTVLLEQILRERLERLGRPGDRFASEPELSAEFGVSRTLLRSVIDRLIADGLLRREGRRGTFVNRAPSAAPDLQLFDVIQRLSAYDPSWQVEVRSISQVQGFADIRQRLGMPADETLMLIERRSSIDDRPLSYTRSYVPLAHAASFTKADLQRHPISHLIPDRTGLRISRVDEYLEPELADVTSARMLEVPLGSALLAVERTYFDVGGAPIFISRAAFRKGRYRFVHEIDGQPD